jgi:hypothetical protein
MQTCSLHCPNAEIAMQYFKMKSFDIIDEHCAALAQKARKMMPYR